MLTKDNEYMDEAAQTLYKYNSDALIREQCRARETRLFFERSDQAKIKEQTEKLKAQDEKIKVQEAKITTLSAKIADMDAENAPLSQQKFALKEVR